MAIIVHRSYWDNDVRVNDVHVMHLFADLNLIYRNKIPTRASFSFLGVLTISYGKGSC